MAALPQGSVALGCPTTNPHCAASRLATDQSVIATYTAGQGTIDVHGIDLAVDYQMNDKWLFAMSYSNQDKIVFPEIGGVNPLMSNSPKNRGSINVTHTDESSGIT